MDFNFLSVILPKKIGPFRRPEVKNPMIMFLQKNRPSVSGRGAIFIKQVIELNPLMLD
jgi:hypothetical protein